MSDQGELKPRATLPEKQGTILTGGEGGGHFASTLANGSLEPMLSIIGGVTCALLLMTVVIFVTLKLKCAHHHRQLQQGGVAMGGVAGGGARGGGRESGGKKWKTSDEGRGKNKMGAGPSEDGDLLQSSPGKISTYNPLIRIQMR